MTVPQLQRSASVAYGGALPVAEDLQGPAAGWHAALPYTRITDYGMDAADARELLWRTAQGEDWVAAGDEIGRRQLTRAALSEREGNELTAIAAMRAGAAALNVAQVPLTFDEPRKHELYERFQMSVQDYANRRGDMRRLVVDYDGGAVEGWLLLPRQEPAGTVVVWGGLSGWGAAYLNVAEEIAARGMACILAEGPGQGATRLTSGIYGSAAALDGYRRFIDVATSDPDLMGAPVGIYGNSLGGMLAARVTAMDTRVSACAVNCAPAAVDLPDQPAAQDQFFAFLGTTDTDLARRQIADLVFAPARDLISVPLLVLHGGADPFVLEANIAQFLDAASHSDTTFLTWADGEHTLYNHASERDATVADWFRHRLSPLPATSDTTAAV